MPGAAPTPGEPGTPTTPASDRVPLPQVHDLLQIGRALPFGVLDSQERRLLGEGHVLHDEAQFEALLERGAWAERSRVEAEQGEPPTRQQLEKLRAHPEASVALLRAAGIDDEDWLAAVAGHHEHAGGGGYPRGHAEPGSAAQLPRAADVYLADIDAAGPAQHRRAAEDPVR